MAAAPPARNALLHAAREGDTKLFLEALLRAERGGRVGKCLRQLTTGGNSALHVAAAGRHPVLAELICRQDATLGAELNAQLETPLHAAAKAGCADTTAVIVSSLRDIGLANAALRARNRRGESALHEAVRFGHAEVARMLLKEDEGLASVLDEKRASPLYMAAASGSLGIVRLLCESIEVKNGEAMSSAGPDLQTALHAAVLHSKEMAEVILLWNPALTKQVDLSGSTPLHYAASAGSHHSVKLLLEHDTSAAYLVDSDGLLPVHVAARFGHSNVIGEISRRCSDCDEMIDSRGRNFLHVAIENKKWAVIKYFQGSSILERMVNAMDINGNTLLHLAAQSGDQISISLLMSNCSVKTNIVNDMGLTALDLAVLGTDRGVAYTLNPQVIILCCLAWTGSVLSPRRLDHFIDSFRIGQYTDQELKKYRNITQNVVIGSVLIATITFAAVFTMPGGFIADGHPDAGTPILVKQYAFKAFVTSNTLAFVGSLLSTIWLTYAGSEHVHEQIRGVYMLLSIIAMEQATRSLVITFALGTYVILGKVSRNIAISVGAVTVTTLVLRNLSSWQLAFLVLPINQRLGWMGLFRTQLSPETRGRLTIGIGHSIAHMVLRRTLSMLFTYAFIFLLALL